MDKKVLIVNREQRFLDFLGINLDKEGFQTSTADSMISAVKHIHQEVPDVILMGIDLPEMSGIQFISQLKAAEMTRSCKVIAITESDDESVEALAAGADDYLIKPFGFSTLVTTITAVIERGSDASEDVDGIITIGMIEIDTLTKRVFIDDYEIDLTPKEYKILVSLVTAGGRVMTREELLVSAFGGSKAALPRLVDVHIASLRNKLGLERGIVETVHGMGYRIVTNQRETIW